MSGNTLTVVLTLAGITAGSLTSWWFSRSSRRDAVAQRISLQKEIAALRSLLSGVAESLSKTTITEHDVQQVVQSVEFSDEPASAVATSLSSVASTSALDALIRASLGTLLNEHGEVNVARLLQAVTRAVPNLGLSSIVSSLEGLRRTGKLSWEGDDVRTAEVIKVHP